MPYAQGIAASRMATVTLTRLVRNAIAWSIVITTSFLLNFEPGTLNSELPSPNLARQARPEINEPAAVGAAAEVLLLEAGRRVVGAGGAGKAQLSRNFSDMRDAHSQPAGDFLVGHLQGQQIPDSLCVTVLGSNGHDVPPHGP